MPAWVPDADPSPMMELERVVLERLQVAAQTAVTRQLLASADLRMVGDQIADMLMVRLSSYVLAEHLADHTQTSTLHVPASWWDHLKISLPWGLEHWWNRWMWRLAPARYHARILTVTWTDRAVYPHANLPLPDRRLGPVVFWRTATTHLEDH
jgi:hypothetical protein